MIDIGSTATDTQVLLDTLVGTHKRSRSARLWEFAVIATVSTGMISFLIKMALAPLTVSDRLTLAGLLLLFLWLPAYVWINGATEYQFSSQSVERRNRFWGSWCLQSGAIQRIALELRNGHWILVFHTTDARLLRVLVTESMAKALEPLYPGLFRSSGQVTVPTFVRNLLFIVLGLVVVAIVVIVVTLKRVAP